MDEEIKKQELRDALRESRNEFMEGMKAYENISESFWTGMSKEEQLWAFCAVIRRLHKAEVEEGRSYRGTLYSVFEFGPESYAVAQMSGFMDIHNSIYRYDGLVDVIKNVLKTLEVEVDDTKLNDAVAKHFY